jgi:hypothetical protein
MEDDAKSNDDNISCANDTDNNGDEILYDGKDIPEKIIDVKGRLVPVRSYMKMLEVLSF